MEQLNNSKISEAVIRRLTSYLRCIRHAADLGIVMLTSQDISEKCGLKSSIIRKDLALFGAYGVKGTGYNVSELMKQLNKILGLDKTKDVILIGAGHLGTAIVRYPGFANVNFNFVAAFDTDPSKIGATIGTTPVRSLDELNSIIKKYKVEIVVLTVPATEAEAIVNQLDSSQVKGVLNFTSVIFPPRQNNLHIHNIDLAKELEVISYCMKKCLS